MKNNNFTVLGVMSGTSLDGIDLCYSRFTYDDSWEFDIIKSTTIPYSNIWREKLSSAITDSQDSPGNLNKDYTSKNSFLKHLETIICNITIFHDKKV